MTDNTARLSAGELDAIEQGINSIGKINAADRTASVNLKAFEYAVLLLAEVRRLTAELEEWRNGRRYTIGSLTQPDPAIAELQRRVGALENRLSPPSTNTLNDAPVPCGICLGEGYIAGGVQCSSCDGTGISLMSRRKMNSRPRQGGEG